MKERVLTMMRDAGFEEKSPGVFVMPTARTHTEEPFREIATWAREHGVGWEWFDIASVYFRSDGRE